MKKYIRSASQPQGNDKLSVDEILDRLVEYGGWGGYAIDSVAFRLDDDSYYDLEELSEILIDDILASGEYKTQKDAVEWGEACAKAVFNKADPNDFV